MINLFKQDVQRWIVPGQVADISQVTWKKTFILLFRHMQLRAMLLFRLAGWCHRKRIRGLPTLLLRTISLFYGLEIAASPEIGGGFYIAHTYGTVIMPAKIGRNCSIISNVTIGMRNEWAFPEIGDHVFIGAGARVLGRIHVGSGARIGANAVVIEDVPEEATVVGVPARVVGINKTGSPEAASDGNQLEAELLI
jgi:serine O-acetyltransferase